MEKERLNYEADVSIDPDALDIEWLKDAKLTMKYTEALADAQAKLRELHETVVPVTQAELASYIRKNPSDFEIDKLTEGALKEVLAISLSINWTPPKRAEKLVFAYRAAHIDELEAEHEVDILKGAVKSMDRRSSALEGLAFLFGRQYFAGPKIPHELGDQWKTYIEGAENKRKVDVRERIKNSMNRRT